MGPPLHTYNQLPCTTFNRVFAFIYIFAIAAIIYHHFLTLLHHSTTFISFTITTSLLISDLILAFMWATSTSFRIRPILRQAFPENLDKVLHKKDFPAIDIFICTADPYKEPPMNVVNTALSLMAYDYPPEKISVYVSDDGGSELTLFAFMEAAKFAKIWLPFCRNNNVMDRCPEAYFGSESHGKAELESEEVKVWLRTSPNPTGKHITESPNMGPPIHTYNQMPCTTFNRVFAFIYTLAIAAIIYHHFLTLLHHSTTFISFTITTSLLISDLILAFMWATTTSFRLRPILRQVFPENLDKVLHKKDFPAIDIFICTADPYKEPPMNVVNTALSLMAYDYPTEKISVYVSDDGGSELTLFAFMEAAKFAKIWLPFCRDSNLMDRCPEAYFGSKSHGKAELESEEIKVIYESMKAKVEYVVERGEVCPDYITNEPQRQIFNKYRAPGFARSHHPPIIQVLIDGEKEKDEEGQSMPNLVYVSRGKNNTSPHHFKAGALNTLLRVSGVMTNAPIVLTQDCDMYSNDPHTPKRALCYISDPSVRPNLGYIQFPQRYHGLNKDDIYGGEFLRLFVANPVGMDGLQGPSYVGSGCFFHRRVFFGGPTSMVLPEIQELRPDCVVAKSITTEAISELANHVADCDYESNTNWGIQLGFRYGSLVEDYFTGYRLQCEGWESIFCHPSRPAFLGDVPISLIDAVSQTKRWAIGLLEVGFSKKYTPVVFGSRCMGYIMGLCYAHYAFWPILSIPIVIYSFVPQIALLNGLYIFPEVADPWFLLYVFVFLGAYGQDCYDFILFGSTYKRWWNDQRIWLIRGLAPYLFGLVEYIVKHLGIATQGFIVTSKVVDGEQSKRYDQGLMEFGVHSPMFLPLTTASIVSLFAFVVGLLQMLSLWNVEKLFAQLFIAGFGVLNSWPIYEAMLLRSDKGRIPIKTTITSICLASFLCGVAVLVL